MGELQRGELVGLRWIDVALDAGTLTVAQQRTTANHAVEAGVEYHPHRFTKIFEDAVKRAGVPRIRLHDTWHTMVTLALEAGVHPKGRATICPRAVSNDCPVTAT